MKSNFVNDVRNLEHARLAVETWKSQAVTPRQSLYRLPEKMRLPFRPGLEASACPTIGAQLLPKSAELGRGAREIVIHNNWSERVTTPERRDGRRERERERRYEIRSTLHLLRDRFFVSGRRRRHARRFGPGIICLAARRRRSLAEAMFGSVARSVMTRNSQPVLLVRPGEL